jgi:O-methyltransferase
MQQQLRLFYIRWVRPYLKQELTRQRIKLIYWVWGYAPLLRSPLWPLRVRLAILKRFLTVDWNVLHAHRPDEICDVFQVLAERPAQAGEVMVEAGCFNGGSAAKFSILCHLLGYRLQVYDSFQGVEPLSAEAKAIDFDFSGTYASSKETVINNVKKYGEYSVCSFHPGWFADTLARHPVREPVRVAYIDCDVVKGTEEVLLGVSASLTPDGCIFSQDFHIAPVRDMLQNADTWARCHKPLPRIRRLSEQLASMRFNMERL